MILARCRTFGTHLPSTNLSEKTFDFRLSIHKNLNITNETSFHDLDFRAKMPDNALLKVCLDTTLSNALARYISGGPLRVSAPKKDLEFNLGVSKEVLLGSVAAGLPSGGRIGTVTSAVQDFSCRPPYSYLTRVLQIWSINSLLNSIDFCYNNYISITLSAQRKHI